MRKIFKAFIGMFENENKPKVCSHPNKLREYYRSGCYKCFECKKIIIEKEL